VVVEPGKPRAVDARAGTCQPDSDSARGESVPTYLPAYLPTYYVGRPPMLLPHHLHSVTRLLTHSSTHPSTHPFTHPFSILHPSIHSLTHPLVCPSPRRCQLQPHPCTAPCTPPCSPALSVPAGALLRRAKHARFREGLAEGMRRHGSLLPEISARAALLPCSHAPMLCPALSPPSLEWLSLASTLASSSLYQRPVGQNIFAAA
jgi:hypothetical protein